MNQIKKVAFTAAMLATIGSAQAITVTSSTDATALATALGGAGVTISNASLTLATSTAAGTFTGGAGSVGFDSGVVLTSGTVDCVVGPNDQSGCTGGGVTTALDFDFTSTTGKLFFNFVFGSEEYNEWVNTQYNDTFQLLLNGTNLALVPGSSDVISINNINCGKNSGFYKNNSSGPDGCPNLGLDIQYDGLTVVLTAEANVNAGLNHFQFLIQDFGDSILDSGVFIKAGSFSGENPNPTPEPGTLALAGIALAGLALGRRRKA